MTYEQIQNICIELKNGENESIINKRYLLAPNALNAINVVYESVSKYHNTLHQELQEKIKNLKALADRNKVKSIKAPMIMMEESHKVKIEKKENIMSKDIYEALERKYERLRDENERLKNNYLHKINILEKKIEYLEKTPEWIVRVFNSLG